MKSLYFLSNKKGDFHRIMHCFKDTGYQINNSIGINEDADDIKLLLGLDRGINSYWRVDKSRLDILHVGYIK